MEDLVNRLNAYCDAMPFETGWYLKDLKTGNSSDRNGAVVLPSASVRKIAIMMTGMQAITAGKISLQQRVPIEEIYQNNDSGCFQHFQPDFDISFRDAMVMMIIVSDNTCTGAVANLLGLDAINEFSQSIGMIGTTHRFGIPPGGMTGQYSAAETNSTTPSDVGLLLEIILAGTRDKHTAKQLGTTPELCQLAIDILTWQRLKNRIPLLLPSGTKVAHKTGTSGRNHNDAGIIYFGDQPGFIFSAFTDEVPSKLDDGIPGAFGASHLIGRMARHCFDELA